MYYKSNRANFKIPCLPCTERNALGGGGGLEFMSATSMGSNRGFYLSSALQKSNASSCLSCLLARGLFKQFEIKRCLLLVVQTFMIPHKAHICTAGIAHWRRGTKDLNDLTEKREKGYNFNIIVYKLQQCSN